MSQQNYNAEAIEVLNGLNPVKRRPVCIQIPRGQII